MAPSSDTSMSGHAPPLPTRPHIDLYESTPDERQTYYKQLFSKKVEPLAYIAVPDECEDWPDFRSELIDAYLTWTTFSVKLWINYDTAAQRFYIDSRIDDCGKLVFKPSELDRLSATDPDQTMQVTRVIFEIGTPFTTLSTLKLWSAPAQEHGRVVGIDITAKMGYIDSNHARAVDFVANRCHDLDQGRITGGNTAFVMSDLEEIAGYFRREPTKDAVNKMRWSSNPAPWMNFEDGRSENSGWLDLEALDKDCYGGCDGCTHKKWTRFSGWTSSSYFR